MNFFTNICDSTSASYSPWKNGFFLPDDQHPIQCNPQQVIHLCLLGSAIEEGTKFFNKLGMKPVWSHESLIPVRDSLSARQQEGDKTVPDLLTMITLSHNMRMNRRIKPEDKNKQQETKKIAVDRLSRCNMETRGKKNQFPSQLASRTIGGNSTADPRSKEGKPLIDIVFNDRGIDKNDEETLFTAKIEDHYQLLLKNYDTIFVDVLKSDVGDSTSVDGDADDVDGMSAEDDVGVTGYDAGYDDDDEERGRGEEVSERSNEERGSGEEVSLDEEEEEEEQPGRGRGRARGGKGRGNGGEGRGTGGERVRESEGSDDEEEESTIGGRLRKRGTGGGRGGGIIGGGDRTGSLKRKRKRKRKGKVNPTRGHEVQEIIQGGSEQGSGREEDHNIIPNTTLENQSEEEEDEDTDESICMKIVSIINDIGQTLCEIDGCPFKDEIADISENFSKIYLKTALHFSLAAHGEHEQAFMDRSHKSLTKQAGLNADLFSSSSEEEEDSDEESKKRSQFIDYEAVIDGNEDDSDEEDSDEESNKAGRSRFIDDEAAEDGNEDAFSPDYEEGEEGRNENSGGQETFEMETFFSDVSMIMEDFP
jgi:hypothetical protein